MLTGRSSLVLNGGVPVLVNSLRYLIDGAVPHANNFSSSASSSSASSSRHSSGGNGTEAHRRNTKVDKSAAVVEDLSLFYALATLTNLCESSVYRTMIIGVGRFDVIAHLVDIVDSLDATSDQAINQVTFVFG